MSGFRTAIPLKARRANLNVRCPAPFVRCLFGYQDRLALFHFFREAPQFATERF